MVDLYPFSICDASFWIKYMEYLIYPDTKMNRGQFRNRIECSGFRKRIKMMEFWR